MAETETPHMDVDEQDAGKGAVEGDRPEDRPQQGNPHGPALDDKGLPKDTTAICEDVIGANVDGSEG
ncbi:MAG TPA: hypothetical protein VFJ02_22535 [Vicinamibacterales bacterium]|nr:hypothetical protein [Vicinamibacterales bacterium]